MLCTILLSTLHIGIAIHTLSIRHMTAAAVAITITIAVGLLSARCLGLTRTLTVTRRLTLTIARLARRSCAPALERCFSAEETDCLYASRSWHCQEFQKRVLGDEHQGEAAAGEQATKAMY